MKYIALICISFLCIGAVSAQSVRAMPEATGTIIKGDLRFAVSTKQFQQLHQIKFDSMASFVNKSLGLEITSGKLDTILKKLVLYFIDNDSLSIDFENIEGLIDGDLTDDQTLSYDASTNVITISGGNTIDITEVDTDNQGLDVFTYADDTLSISLDDNAITSKVQIISGTGNTGNTGDSTTVTDQANGLDIVEAANAITVSLDIEELTSVEPTLSDKALIQDADDSNNEKTATFTEIQTLIDTDTQLSQEQVEDAAGAMVSGNTETLITVTYQDGTGDIDFVVDPNLSHYTNDAGFITTATAARGVTDRINGLDIELNGNNIEIALDPSESATQAPVLADLIIIEDVTDGGIHSATLAQLKTLIDTDTDTDTDTQLSNEQVEDISGAMLSGNTESLITVTYQDGTGDIDFVVDPNLSHYTNDAGFITTATAARGVTDRVNGLDISLNGNNIEIALDPSESSTQAPDLADLVIIEDVTDGGIHSATLAQLKTLIGASDGIVTDTDTQLSNEQVEDIAGALVANTSGTHTGISVTYQDATGDVDLVIDHDAATNFVAGEHILHSGVTITAGDGLSGGGTIAATRTIDIDPSEMPGQAPVLADIVIIEDVTDGGIHSATLAQLKTLIDTDTDTDTNTQLSYEQVEDISGAMLSGNTESLITVTYQDGTGDIDFVVDPNLSHYTNDAGFITTATAARGVTDRVNGLDISLNGNNIEIALDPSESSTQAPDLADLVIIEDVTDGGIHSATLAQLKTLIGASDGIVTDTDTQLSNEQVEDIAGALVANTSGTHTGISVTYQDATGDVDLVIDHDAATNFVAGEHILHSGVTITAGDGLSGGGTIAATRTIDIDPSEMPGQAPVLADIVIIEDVTDGGIHSATLAQLKTLIDTDTDTDTNTQLSYEQVEDISGAMLSGNTESLITVTYQDGTGDIDFVVDPNLSHYTNDAGFITTATAARGVTDQVNGLDIELNGNNIEIGLDPSESSTQAPDLADLVIIEDVTDGGIHAATLTQLRTVIDTDTQRGVTNYANGLDINLYNNNIYISLDPSESSEQTPSLNDIVIIEDVTDGGIHSATLTQLKAVIDTDTDTDTQLSNEQVEDIAGALVANTSGTHTGISVTYQDATGDVDLVIDHDAALNFVSGEHIDHSGVFITAGDALSGGGTIRQTRTINVDPSEMPGQAPDLADIIIVEDVTDGGIHSATLRQLRTAINTNTQLSQEQVEDAAGAMVTGNTETLITVTYQDGTGDIDYVVDPNLSNYTNDAGFVTSSTAARGVTDRINGLDIELNGNNIEIALDPSESATQAPVLADLIIIEDVTDGGIHSATLAQLKAVIDTDTDTDTQLSNEQVEDAAGAMVSGNTESLITVTYQDDTGDIDFVVDPNLSHYTNDAGFITTATSARGVTDRNNGLDISLNGNNIEIGLDPSESSTQTPSLSDLVIVEDVTDGGIHAATLTQLRTVINTDTNTHLSQEQVEDFAGNIVANTSGTHTGITVTYQDATGDMDLDVDHDAATNFVAGEHVLHSDVTITAGDGLSGGGTIAATRTIDIDPSEMPGQAPVLADIVIIEDVTDGGIHSATLAQLKTLIDTDTDTDTNTQLSYEQVEDRAGAMVSGNTESLITVTYQDNTGDIDFVVDPSLSNYTNDAGFITTATSARGVTDRNNGLDISLNGNNIEIGLDPSESSTQTPSLSDLVIVEDVTDGGIHAATLTQLRTAINTNTHLSREAVEDIAGAMVSGNTESLITVTYQDGTGDIDYVVESRLSNYINDAGFVTSAASPRGVTDRGNGLDIELNGNNIEIALDPSENAKQAPALADLVIIEDVTDGGIHAATLAQLQSAIIANDAVTYARIQNVVTNNVFLGTDGGAGSIIEELTASASRTILDITDKSIYMALGSRTTVFTVGHMIVPLEVGAEHDDVTITHATLQCVTYSTNPSIEIYLNGVGQTAHQYDGNGSEENITDFTIDKGEYIEVYVTAIGGVVGCGITLNGRKN